MKTEGRFTRFLAPRLRGAPQRALHFLPLFLALFSVLLIVFSLCLGRYPLSLGDVIGAFFSAPGTAAGQSSQAFNIVWRLRLPRILAAWFVGAALACSGAAGQGVFRNELVSPDILGAAAGASFGASLGILWALPAAFVQLLSFFAGICAVTLTSLVNSRAGGGTVTLVLSGIMVSALGTSLTSLVKIFADSKDTLPAITFWLLGSLTQISWAQTLSVALPVLTLSFPLFYLGWRLNVLSLGDEQAGALGLPVRFLRGLFVVLATVLTAAAVSVSGIIGWVGLLVPHMARFIVGQDYRRVLPVAALLGGCYLLCIDTLARTVSAAEIPLGVLTSLFGAPFFIALIIRHGRHRAAGGEP